MKIEIAKIPQDGLIIDDDFVFDEECYHNIDLEGLKNVHFCGKLFIGYENELQLEGTLSGIMILQDACTLDLRERPFSIQVETQIDDNNEETREYLEKEKNILDIMGILWQNIVLEVPMRYTEVDNMNASGEGWEFVHEKKEEIDPRLAPLKELLEGKE